MPVNKDDFWAKKKEEFLQRMQQKGFDMFQVQDWIDQRGLPSIDEYVILDNLNNPGYVNPLKGMMVQPQQQQVMYGYNPGAAQAQMVPPQGMVHPQQQQQLMQP